MAPGEPVLLETPRLVLRTPRPSEAAAVARYHGRNRDFHAASSPLQAEEFYSRTHWERRIPLLRAEARRGTGLRVYLFDRGAGALLGHASLSRITPYPFHAASLGFSLAREAEGRGLMTEALRALVAHAFGPMGLHRIEAGHLPSNRRSAAVLRRLGFRREGLARDFLLVGGRWRDHVLRSLTHRRWRPAPESSGAPRRAPRGGRGGGD